MKRKNDISNTTVILSVIVPAYNSETTIRRCLESIQQTDCIPIEIIVVDDGSTDHTGEICDKIASIDSRINIIHKDNGGVSSARNVGIMHAQGAFLAFVDSDDTVSADMFYHLIKLMEINDADCAMCNTENIYLSHRENKPHAFGSKILVGNQCIHDQVIIPLLEAGHPRALWLASSCNKIYRTELIKKYCLQFRNLPRAEDWLFNIEYLNVANIMAFSEEYLYQYYRSTDFSLSKIWKLEYFDYAIWIQKYLRSIFPERYSSISIDRSVIDIQINELQMYATCCGIKGFFKYTKGLFYHKALRSAYNHSPDLPNRYVVSKWCMKKNRRFMFYIWCIWLAKESLVKYYLRPFYRKTQKLMYHITQIINHA